MKSDHAAGEGVRYRLRFVIQEFDLPLGDTVLGRGDECHITLFDPAVSRRHARVHVGAEGVVIEDLGSRNGSRVNGAIIKTPTKLVDGDRIRLGTQELVVGEVRNRTSVGRDTGSLCYCASCRAAYAREMDTCPHCGSTSRSDESITDVHPDDPFGSRGRFATSPPTR